MWGNEGETKGGEGGLKKQSHLFDGSRRKVVTSAASWDSSVFLLKSEDKTLRCTLTEVI